jgi:Rrf2 family protein
MNRDAKAGGFEIEVLMKLSRSSSYALHAVVYLAARKSDSLVGSPDIAQLLGITENRLVRVLKSLVSARILWSLRGPGGGYRLARPASRVSVLDIIEGVAGRVRSVVPPLAQPGHEIVERRLEVICEQVAEYTRNVLAKIYISDLLEKSERALPFQGSAEEKHPLPPEVAEGLERIRRLMAARDGGLDRSEKV